MGVEHLQILSLNFQHASIGDVGLLHVAPDEQPAVLNNWKIQLGLQGIVFLSTDKGEGVLLQHDTVNTDKR